MDKKLIFLHLLDINLYLGLCKKFGHELLHESSYFTVKSKICIYNYKFIWDTQRFYIHFNTKTKLYYL